MDVVREISISARQLHPHGHLLLLDLAVVDVSVSDFLCFLGFSRGSGLYLNY